MKLSLVPPRATAVLTAALAWGALTPTQAGAQSYVLPGNDTGFGEGPGSALLLLSAAGLVMRRRH